MRIGAHYLGQEGGEFVVWSPFAKDVAVQIIAPDERVIPMSRDEWGYWRAANQDIFPETLYFYRLEGDSLRPDPASHYQPQGVHGPSLVIDHSAFRWEDSSWGGIALKEMVLYELHAGTFTPEGTFEAIIPRLEELRELGVNTIELMPVAQFPGDRNWGYDGVYPFAVQNSYGGPEGLKRLVNASHRAGLAVTLDVVYNHLGPEGNYLDNFGPYFTEKYKTPWGRALNFDGPYSGGVRDYFIANALYWFREYHIDALRLDAVHAIYDMGARHFLQELAERVAALSHEQGRRLLLIAESDLNDVRVIRPRELGGYGLDAQWCDEFHHSLRTLLTKDTRGYFEDFGQVEHLAKALRDGFVYDWQYSPHRKRRFGSSSADRPGEQFVVFTQNHDQVGNRMLGERLSQLIPFEGQKLAAGALLVSPFVPMLFMGEEYGEEAPFLYFVSHSDPDLIAAVRAGRRAEFQAFQLEGEAPDPQNPETFLRSKLNWAQRNEGRHKLLLDFYRRLFELRRQLPALANLAKNCLEVWAGEQDLLVCVRRWHNQSQIFSTLNFDQKAGVCRPKLATGIWEKLIDSAEKAWGGPGASLPETAEPEQELVVAPLSFALYCKKAPE